MRGVIDLCTLHQRRMHHVDRKFCCASAPPKRSLWSSASVKRCLQSTGWLMAVSWRRRTEQTRASICTSRALRSKQGVNSIKCPFVQTPLGVLVLRCILSRDARFSKVGDWLCSFSHDCKIMTEDLWHSRNQALSVMLNVWCPQLNCRKFHYW